MDTDYRANDPDSIWVRFDRLGFLRADERAAIEAFRKGPEQASEDAPDRLSLLRDENAKLEAALRQIAYSYDWVPFEANETVAKPAPDAPGRVLGWFPSNRRIAREALGLPQDARAVTGGIELITAERERQVAVEGWTADHDVQHDHGELARAAACYAVNDEYRWPWTAEWWKPGDDEVRRLVKAGALIAAEIDRLQRAAPPSRLSVREGTER